VNQKIRQDVWEALTRQVTIRDALRALPDGAVEELVEELVGVCLVHAVAPQTGSQCRDPRIKVEYFSNNSGGDWWLEDHHWKALADNGWAVDWDRMRATRHGLSLQDAVEEWATLTGLDPDEDGCECCGRPHAFYESHISLLEETC
jgi:hypothetical protein